MTGTELGFALLALAIGVLMTRASLCSVACLHELIVDRRIDGILRLAIAASAAGLVLLTLAAWSPDRVLLPADPPVMREALVGGLLLGLGAVINGACYIGTVVYLARGRLGFLLTLAGLLLVLRFTAMPMHVAEADATRRAMGGEPIAGLAVFAALLAFAAVAVSRGIAASPDRRQALLTTTISAAGVGILAACVYAGHPNWNYTSVLAALAHAGRGPASWSGYAAALALLVGATAGSIAAHRFELRGFGVTRAARSFVGGAVMGVGAMQAAGGHDLLLLWSIPGLARGAMLAFIAMALTVAALLAAGARLRRP